MSDTAPWRDPRIDPRAGDILDRFGKVVVVVHRAFTEVMVWSDKNRKDSAMWVALDDWQSDMLTVSILAQY